MRDFGLPLYALLKSSRKNVSNRALDTHILTMSQTVTPVQARTRFCARYEISQKRRATPVGLTYEGVEAFRDVRTTV